MRIHKTKLSKLRKYDLGPELRYSTDKDGLLEKVLRCLGIKADFIKLLNNDQIVYMMKGIILEYTNANLNKLWVIVLISNGKCAISNITKDIIKISLPNCDILVNNKVKKLVIIGEHIDIGDRYRIIRKRDGREIGIIDKEFRYVDMYNSLIRGTLNYGK